MIEKDAEWRIKAQLHNDIARAPKTKRRHRHILFSQRREIADYLYEQGWRKP